MIAAVRVRGAALIKADDVERVLANVGREVEPRLEDVFIHMLSQSGDEP